MAPPERVTVASLREMAAAARPQFHPVAIQGHRADTPPQSTFGPLSECIEAASGNPQPDDTPNFERAGPLLPELQGKKDITGAPTPAAMLGASPQSPADVLALYRCWKATQDHLEVRASMDDAEIRAAADRANGGHAAENQGFAELVAVLCIEAFRPSTASSPRSRTKAAFTAAVWARTRHPNCLFVAPWFAQLDPYGSFAAEEPSPAASPRVRPLAHDLWTLPTIVKEYGDVISRFCERAAEADDGSWHGMAAADCQPFIKLRFGPKDKIPESRSFFADDLVALSSRRPWAAHVSVLYAHYGFAVGSPILPKFEDPRELIFGSSLIVAFVAECHRARCTGQKSPLATASPPVPPVVAQWALPVWQLSAAFSATHPTLALDPFFTPRAMEWLLSSGAVLPVVDIGGERVVVAPRTMAEQRHALHVLILGARYTRTPEDPSPGLLMDECYRFASLFDDAPFDFSQLPFVDLRSPLCHLHGNASDTMPSDLDHRVANIDSATDAAVERLLIPAPVADVDPTPLAEGDWGRVAALFASAKPVSTDGVTPHLAHLGDRDGVFVEIAAFDGLPWWTAPFSGFLQLVRHVRYDAAAVRDPAARLAQGLQDAAVLVPPNTTTEDRTHLLRPLLFWLFRGSEAKTVPDAVELCNRALGDSIAVPLPLVADVFGAAAAVEGYTPPRKDFRDFIPAAASHAPPKSAATVPDTREAVRAAAAAQLCSLVEEETQGRHVVETEEGPQRQKIERDHTKSLKEVRQRQKQAQERLLREQALEQQRREEEQREREKEERLQRAREKKAEEERVKLEQRRRDQERKAEQLRKEKEEREEKERRREQERAERARQELKRKENEEARRRLAEQLEREKAAKQRAQQIADQQERFMHEEDTARRAVEALARRTMQDEHDRSLADARQREQQAEQFRREKQKRASEAPAKAAGRRVLSSKELFAHTPPPETPKVESPSPKIETPKVESPSLKVEAPEVEPPSWKNAAPKVEAPKIETATVEAPGPAPSTNVDSPRSSPAKFVPSVPVAAVPAKGKRKEVKSKEMNPTEKELEVAAPPQPDDDDGNASTATGDSTGVAEVYSGIMADPCSLAVFARTRASEHSTTVYRILLSLAQDTPEYLAFTDAAATKIAQRSWMSPMCVRLYKVHPELKQDRRRRGIAIANLTDAKLVVTTEGEKKTFLELVKPIPCRSEKEATLLHDLVNGHPWTEADDAGVHPALNAAFPLIPTWKSRVGSACISRAIWRTLLTCTVFSEAIAMNRGSKSGAVSQEVCRNMCRELLTSNATEEILRALGRSSTIVGGTNDSICPLSEVHARKFATDAAILRDEYSSFGAAAACDSFARAYVMACSALRTATPPLADVESYFSRCHPLGRCILWRRAWIMILLNPATPARFTTGSDAADEDAAPDTRRVALARVEDGRLVFDVAKLLRCNAGAPFRDPLVRSPHLPASFYAEEPTKAPVETASADSSSDSSSDTSSTGASTSGSTSDSGAVTEDDDAGRDDDPGTVDASSDARRCPPPSALGALPRPAPRPNLTPSAAALREQWEAYALRLEAEVAPFVAWVFVAAVAHSCQVSEEGKVTFDSAMSFDDAAAAVLGPRRSVTAKACAFIFAAPPFAQGSPRRTPGPALRRLAAVSHAVLTAIFSESVEVVSTARLDSACTDTAASEFVSVAFSRDTLLKDVAQNLSELAPGTECEEDADAAIDYAVASGVLSPVAAADSHRILAPASWSGPVATPMKLRVFLELLASDAESTS